MGGGDDPPPYGPHHEHSSTRGSIARDGILAEQIRALRLGNTSKSTISVGQSSSRMTPSTTGSDTSSSWQSSSKTRSTTTQSDILGRQSPIISSANVIGENSNTRERCIDTGIKPLKAQLDLYDLLSIHSSVGSINVGIHIRAADVRHPIPAKLIIGSSSGSVTVHMPAANAPVRDNSISIESQSGSVRGELIHGRTTSVLSRSGSITLQLTPSNSSKDSSTLSTTSQSGRSEITVLSSNSGAMADGPSPIKQLTSTHSTDSGGLSLRYPREWEGVIEGYTEYGSFRIHGKDVEIIQQSSQYVLAKKGTGNSKLSFRTSSGSANVYFE